MKKVLFVIICAVFTTVSFQKSIPTNSKSELLSENVEALAKTESIGNSTIKGDCFSSVVYIVECSVYCNKCKTVWYPSPRVPKAVAENVTGACECGNTSFL
ncbi:MAG: hypothetical protein EGP82_00230 [Odoribacter splanchnicus]|nr:hypothetical protein [Odoribacter splanchnicus]